MFESLRAWVWKLHSLMRLAIVLTVVAPWFVPETAEAAGCASNTPAKYRGGEPDCDLVRTAGFGVFGRSCAGSGRGPAGKSRVQP